MNHFAQYSVISPISLLIIYVCILNIMFFEFSAPISAAEDPVLHTVQTVGRLSNKAARRVYTNVSTQLRSLNMQDVKEYVTSLIAVLQLTQLLHYFDQKTEKETPKSDSKSVTEEESKEKQESSEKQ